MKKSKIFVLAVLFLFVIAFAFGYFVYDSLFPLSKQIESPHPDTVLSYSAKDSNNTAYMIDIYTFYDFILNAKPTRIMSVNDYPDVRPYYEVCVSATDNRFYRYFLYSSNGNDYIESPYVGVYEIQNFKINDLFR